MKMRKALTALLAAAMLFTTVPGTALAAGGTGTAEEQGKLFLDKTATLTDNGSYTIKMEAFATGTTTTQTIEKGVPLDIVLVVDQSGSLKDGEKSVDVLPDLKKAATAFVQSVYDNGAEYGVDHRIGMVGFASGATDGSSDTGNDPYHPIAGGNTKTWVNTGIFDENGEFKNYRTIVDAKEDVSYDLFTGDLVSSGEYFVRAGTKYVKLTHSGTGEEYVKIKNPAPDRTDLYGKVNGKYEKAAYGEYTETTKTEVLPRPTEDDGTQYYDKDGNPLTWKTITVPGEKVYQPISEAGNTIKQSESYWIKVDGAYQEISYRRRFSKAWRDESYREYTVAGDNTSFERDGVNYPACKPVTLPDTTKTVLTRSNGKEYKGKVYTQTTATKTGWNVNGTPVTELFELKTGMGKWEYEDDGKKVILTDEQVFVKHSATVESSLTAADYKGALVPVSDEANGQGAQRASLDKAISSFGASGATRMATGIEMGNEIFRNNSLTDADKAAGRKRVMIIFTDGEPGFSGYEEGEANKALMESVETKKELGATVYTIGLYKDNNATRDTFMRNLSSDYPDATVEYKKFTESKDTKKEYYIQLNGKYYAVKYYDEDKIGGQELTGWYYQADDGTYTKPNSKAKYYTAAVNTGTEASKTHYHKVADQAKLNEIFQTIQGEISGSTTQVDLTTTSILRDIMSAEGFELTADSVVTVSVVPGDATNAADETKIAWGKPVPVLTLTNPTHGASATGTYKNMTITASTHMENPEIGKADLHTVDVTGFDYKDQYIAKAHKGSKLVVEITGVKALPTVTTDQNIYTNHEQSGIWAPATEGGERQLKAPFPKRPETYMPSKSFVVDYAKPVDLALAGFKMNTAKNIDMGGYNPFAPANTAITHQYGDVKLEGNKLTYTPKTMQWDGYDSFYVFGTTTDTTVMAASANENGNVWAKVNVIPANNVYYEDSFVSNNPTGTIGITYGGTWEEVKGTEPGQNGGSAEDGIHGWIPVLKDETGDTDGSSHHADATGTNVTAGNVAKATFTFTGTGVDVYSRTNGKTGNITARLVNTTTDKGVVRTFVDTLSDSGEYYQIPTLSIHGLEYGAYRLELTVTTAAEGRYEYYLDGIRVYNPIKTTDSVVNDAYGSDELNATFMEVRDMLLDAKSFSAEENGVSKGAVFIDQIKAGQETSPDKPGTPTTTTVVGTYKDYGPKNEVYLAAGQSVSFKVDTTNGNQFFVGLKSPTGTPVTAGFSGADGKMQMPSITHTGDMYYAVAPASNGVITITNMSKGNELLSITKLKVTNSTSTVAVASVFAETDTPTLLAATQAFMMQEPPVEPEVPDVPVEPDDDDIDDDDFDDDDFDDDDDDDDDDDEFEVEIDDDDRRKHHRHKRHW